MAIYDAFISYSHAKDKPVAAALQTVMQKLGKPWYRRRALRVFRDDTSLSATPHLWMSIERALSQSRYLVLLTSLEAAASPWVSKEVEYWLANKGVDTLLIALTDGTIAWDEKVRDFLWNGASLLPPVLKGRFTSEPKWVDLTAYRSHATPGDPKFIEHSADFAAAIHGIPKEDLLSQEVRQQRRALTLAWSAVGLLFVLVAAAGWEWRKAEVALAQADRNFAAATNVGSSVVESVRDLIGGGTISTKVAEPLLDITRKTILQLEEETPNEKLQVMQWRLLNTLSFAYVNVPGEGANAVELAKKMRSLADSLIAENPKNIEYRQFIITSELRIGDALGAMAVFDSALQHYGAGIEQIKAQLKNDRLNGDLKRLLIYNQQRVGDTLFNKEELSEAEQVYEANLAMAKELAQMPDAKPDWVRGLALAYERMGDIYRALGSLDRAFDQYVLYRKVSEQLVALEKTNIPNWAWRLDLWISHQRLGDILLAQGNAAGALQEYIGFQQWAQEVVKLDSEHGEWERFFANSCLEVGDALLALGRVDEALAQFARAEKEYERLANQDQRPRSKRSLAIAHQRLGLARLAKNDMKLAGDEFAACAAMKIDESAQDGQITVPALVHQDCESRLASVNSLVQR